MTQVESFSPTANSGEPCLRFNTVSMTFPDGTHAVDQVSFDVHPGEFVTVVGPSGCGKSTLLRIASGLTTSTGGGVDIGTKPGMENEAEPRPMQVGYVFQDATLLPWRTVKRNVELLAELAKVPPSELDPRVAANIELVGLSGFENKYPKQLSGGMKMRASLARSLVLEPDVFLFDEPFGAVDEITRERLNDELISLFQAKGFGALFITHSIAEAIFLSTRVLVMSARPGRIVAEYEVPFEYPRSPDLRFDNEFARLSGEVSHSLRGGHR